KGQALHLQVKRPGHEQLVHLEMEPRREAGADAPTIGIIPSDSLEIADFQPPTGMEGPPTTYKPIDREEPDKKVDVLVAAVPGDQELEPVSNIFEYERILANNLDVPVIKHAIERRELSSTGDQGKAIEKFDLSLPTAHFVDLGARMEIEPIKEIRKDSPA